MKQPEPGGWSAYSCCHINIVKPLNSGGFEGLLQLPRSPTPAEQSCRNSATAPCGGGIDSQFLEMAGLNDKNFLKVTCIVIVRICKPPFARQSINCPLRSKNATARIAEIYVQFKLGKSRFESNDYLFFSSCGFKIFFSK